MKHFFIYVLALSAHVSCVQTKNASQVKTQMQGPNSLHQKFIGSWELFASERVDSAGNLIEIIDNKLVVVKQMNSNPTGLLIYTPEGLMSAHVRGAHQPKYPPGNFRIMLMSNQIPCDTLKAGLDAYVAYYGKYTIDSSAGIVTHWVEQSSNNYAAEPKQERRYAFKGNDTLILSAATPFRGIDGRMLNFRNVFKRRK